MKDTRLLQIFQNVKDTICKYDYYIRTSKEIIHLSNTEDKIEKMLRASGIGADEKLVTEIVKVNLKFGIYHTMDMLNDEAGLLVKCRDKREKALVSDFLALLEERRNGI